MKTTQAISLKIWNRSDCLDKLNMKQKTAYKKSEHVPLMFGNIYILAIVNSNINVYT